MLGGRDGVMLLKEMKCVRVVNCANFVHIDLIKKKSEYLMCSCALQLSCSHTKKYDGEDSSHLPSDVNTSCPAVFPIQLSHCFTPTCLTPFWLMPLASLHYTTSYLKLSGFQFNVPWFAFVMLTPYFWRGQDSAVSIATCYRLDGPGIESQWGRDFPHSSRLASEPTQPPIQWVFPRGTASGAWHWPPTPI